MDEDDSWQEAVPVQGDALLALQRKRRRRLAADLERWLAWALSVAYLGLSAGNMESFCRITGDEAEEGSRMEAVKSGALHCYGAMMCLCMVAASAFPDSVRPHVRALADSKLLMWIAGFLAVLMSMDRRVVTPYFSITGGAVALIAVLVCVQMVSSVVLCSAYRELHLMRQQALVPGEADLLEVHSAGYGSIDRCASKGSHEGGVLEGKSDEWGDGEDEAGTPAWAREGASMGSVGSREEDEGSALPAWARETGGGV